MCENASFGVVVEQRVLKMWKWKCMQMAWKILHVNSNRNKYIFCSGFFAAFGDASVFLQFFYFLNVST